MFRDIIHIDWIRRWLYKDDCSRGPHQVGNRCHDPKTGRFTSADRAGEAKDEEARRHRDEERKSSIKQNEIEYRKKGFGVSKSIFGKSMYNYLQESWRRAPINDFQKIAESFVLQNTFTKVLISERDQRQEFLQKPEEFPALNNMVKQGTIRRAEAIPRFFMKLLEYSCQLTEEKIKQNKRKALEYDKSCRQNGITATAIKLALQMGGKVGVGDIQTIEHLACLLTGGMMYEGVPFSTILTMHLLSGAQQSANDWIRTLRTQYNIDDSIVDEMYNEFISGNEENLILMGEEEKSRQEKRIRKLLQKYAPNFQFRTPISKDIIKEEADYAINSIRRGKSIYVTLYEAAASLADYSRSRRGKFKNTMPARELRNIWLKRKRHTLPPPRVNLSQDQQLGPPDIEEQVITKGFSSLRPGRTPVSFDNLTHANYCSWLETKDGLRFIAKFNVRAGSANCEELAYSLDKLLDLNMVPPTFNLGGNFTMGLSKFLGVSMQMDVNRLGLGNIFVSGDDLPPQYQDTCLENPSNGWIHRFFALSEITKNWDLHPGNIMIAPTTGRIVAIDNGASLKGDEFTFRWEIRNVHEHRLTSDDVLDKLLNMDVNAYRRALLHHGFSFDEINAREKAVRNFLRRGGKYKWR